jgi:hypothetical protein
VTNKACRKQKHVSTLPGSPLSRGFGGMITVVVCVSRRFSLPTWIQLKFDYIVEDDYTVISNN